MWQTDAESLTAVQRELAGRVPEPWRPGGRELRTGGCWVCFPRGVTGPGSAADRAWAAAVVWSGGQVIDRAVRRGHAGAPYTPGLMALRMGGLLEQVVRDLTTRPDVLLLDGTSRDHPRRAGLALHLGAELDLPTVGVTHRPLLAVGDWPDDERGAACWLRIDDQVVAGRLRTRPGTRPLVVHPGWRVGLADAVDVVLRTTPRRRTPEPLRHAREAARRARAGAQVR